MRMQSRNKEMSTCLNFEFSLHNNANKTKLTLINLKNENNPLRILYGLKNNDNLSNHLLGC